MNATIYYNPRCGTCRNTLELLESKGIKPKLVEYLKTPPSEGELRGILKKLGLPARDLIRAKEAIYMELGLDNPRINEDDLIRAMVKHPVLIERPVVVIDEKAVIARPPEKALSIL